MKLKYIGPAPDTLIGALPLPEGWGAFDHDEADEALAAAKVASGNYEAEKPPKADAPKEVHGETA